MKLLSDFVVKVGIFEILIVPNFNKLLVLLILGRTGGKYFINTIFDIKIQIRIFRISNVPDFNKF